MGAGPSAKLSAKPRLAGQRQQVAAVCYRLRGGGIEFLLVQTRGGRWIFPKGGVEPGLTHAESAALEAFEEAGVHGRMEKVSFARYFRRKPDTATTKISTRSAARSSEIELAVPAHLCEVSRLEPPQEANRNPTWFSADKAKQRLHKERAPEFGAELARVVDRALSRIQRLHDARHAPDRAHRDGLQKVRFEAPEDGGLHDDLRRAVLARYFLRQRDRRSAAAIEAAVQAHFQNRPVLRLGTGVSAPAAAVRNVTAIDSGRRANLPKPGNSSAGK
ncbi:MAG: NUDIX domain-containing protein [Acidobacteriia bacterium]|nr:NUDIX domain-containing protein [Terriglobia bacterium]